MPSVLLALCDRILLPACARYQLTSAISSSAARATASSAEQMLEPQPEAEQIAWAEMPAGSAVVYIGGVIHGGGANTTAVPRRDEGHGSRG